MTIDMKELQEFCDTCPLAYYAGKPLQLTASEKHRTSCANIVNCKIYISVEQVNDAIKPLKRFVAADLRPVVYHEVSHIIATPRTMYDRYWYVDTVDYSKLNRLSSEDFKKRWPNLNTGRRYHMLGINKIVNIAEDERIETIFRDVYMDVDFKAFCMKVFKPDIHRFPKDQNDFFIRLIRTKQVDMPFFDTKPLLSELKAIIREFAFMRYATEKGIEAYIKRCMDLYAHCVQAYLDYCNEHHIDELIDMIESVIDRSTMSGDECKEKVENGIYTEVEEGRDNMIAKSSMTDQTDQADQTSQTNQSSRTDEDEDEDNKSDKPENDEWPDDEYAHDEDDSDEKDSEEDKPEENESKEDESDEDEDDSDEPEEDEDSDEDDESDDESDEDESTHQHSQGGDEAGDNSLDQHDSKSDDTESVDNFYDDMPETQANVEEMRNLFKSRVFEDYDDDVASLLNQKFFIKTMHDKQMGAIHKYSGKFDVHAVGRDDWKVFKKPSANFSDGSKLGQKMHLIIVLDQSGSYSGNDYATNRILAALRDAEQKVKGFEFDVIKFGRYSRLAKKDERYSESNEGTVYDMTLVNLIKKAKRPDCANFVIFLNDGAAYAICPDLIKGMHEALDHKNSVCIIDWSVYNQHGLFNKFKRAKVIVTHDYTKELSKNVCDALMTMMNV